MLVGENLFLSTNNYLIEYFSRRFAQGTASVIANSRLKSTDDNSLLEALSPVQRDGIIQRRGPFGFHMSFTPSRGEAVSDDDIISIANRIIDLFDMSLNPWLLFRVSGMEQTHYHLISTVIYSSFDEKYWWQHKNTIKEIINNHGYSYGHKSHLKSYQIGIRRGNLTNCIHKRFNEALSFSYCNQKQFESILHLKNLHAYIQNNRISFSHISTLVHNIGPRERERRRLECHCDKKGELYYKMLLFMKPRSYSYPVQYLSRVEKIVEDSFFLGDSFEENLKEFGILIDKTDSKSPVYIDSHRKRVIEHRYFPGRFSEETYLAICSECGWNYGIPTLLDMSHWHPLISPIIGRHKEKPADRFHPKFLTMKTTKK